MAGKIKLSVSFLELVFAAVLERFAQTQDWLDASASTENSKRSLAILVPAIRLYYAGYRVNGIFCRLELYPEVKDFFSKVRAGDEQQAVLKGGSTNAEKTNERIFTFASDQPADGHGGRGRAGLAA